MWPEDEINRKVYAMAKKYQKKYGFEIGEGKHDTWNNEADAFKHTFGSAMIALEWGGNFNSLLAGEIHEWKGNKNMGQSAGEENMDKWNNAVGRQIAKELYPLIHKEARYRFAKKSDYYDLIAEKVMERMKKGDLITHPSDPRKYTDFLKMIKNKINKSKEINDGIREQYRRLQSRNDWMLERIFRGARTKKTSDASSGQGHWVTINGRHVYIS